MNKGEVTRQWIIEQAAPLFNQRGFDGCSMQDIMEATGMEKGGLYRHFSSKEELAAEAFRFALASSVRIRTQDLEHIPGALDRLRHHIKRFTETPSVTPGGCPLLNTAIDADDGNPVLRQLACDGIQDWRTRLCAIIKEGMQSGEIRPDTDSRRISNTIISTLEGAVMISRIEGTKTARRDARASLEKILDAIKL